MEKGSERTEVETGDEFNRVIIWCLGITVDHICDVVCFGVVSCLREWMNACVWNFVVMV